MKVCQTFLVRPLCLQGISLKAVTLTGEKQKIKTRNRCRISEYFAITIFQIWFDDIEKDTSRFFRAGLFRLVSFVNKYYLEVLNVNFSNHDHLMEFVRF